MQKAEKAVSSCFFCGRKHNWRLQVSVSVSPVPVFIFGIQTTLDEFHMEENLCSHNKCLPLLTQDHASFWHEL